MTQRFLPVRAFQVMGSFKQRSLIWTLILISDTSENDSLRIQFWPKFWPEFGWQTHTPWETKIHFTASEVGSKCLRMVFTRPVPDRSHSTLRRILKSPESHLEGHRTLISQAKTIKQVTETDIPTQKSGFVGFILRRQLSNRNRNILKNK